MSLLLFLKEKKKYVSYKREWSMIPQSLLYGRKMIKKIQSVKVKCLYLINGEREGPWSNYQKSHFDALISPNQISLISQHTKFKESHTLSSSLLPPFPLHLYQIPASNQINPSNCCRSVQILAPNFNPIFFGSLYDTLRNFRFSTSDFVSLGTNRNPIPRIRRRQTGFRIQRPSRNPSFVHIECSSVFVHCFCVEIFGF